MNCYFSGTLENLDMAVMLNFFLKKEGLPQIAEEFLGGNLVINKLQLEGALSDIYIHQLDKHVERGFFYEAGLYIKGTYAIPPPPAPPHLPTHTHIHTQTPSYEKPPANPSFQPAPTNGRGTRASKFASRPFNLSP
jgi:hypothetical protein